MRPWPWFIIVLLLFQMSCITPLGNEADREENILTVEGYITTLKGPHNIKLSTSAKYGSVFDGYIKPLQGAQVWIKDQDGNTTYLEEGKLGNYFTPESFQGVIGNSYTLNIETQLKERYTSIPETIVEVPKVDSIFFAYKRLPTPKSYLFEEGLEVFASWRDPEWVSNYYLWRNRGTYNRTIEDKNPDYSVNIYSDRNSSGNQITHRVAFILDDGDRFDYLYTVEVHHLSISKEAHFFYEQLKKLIEIDGDIFDAPPLTLRGNIYNLEDPDANVIGYFHASDVHVIRRPVNQSLLQEF